MENGNTQTPSVPETPVAAGPSAAELQAQLDSLKKESEGRLRDLQSERAKRQELEAKLTPPNPVHQPEMVDVPQDELGKVISPYIKTAVAPLVERVRAAEAVAANSLQDKAMGHLSAKTGKTREQIMVDKDLQDKLEGVVRRYGFNGNIFDVTVKAYEILELENLRSAEAERRRVADANANSSVPAGTTPPPSASNSKEWDSETWADMPLHEYEQYASKGSFRQNKDGKIVFTPNK